MAFRWRVGTVLLAGVVGAAGAQGDASDAQVEANVLKALAGAPELASEAITTQTVYGTVTLSGTVRDEAARRRAETLAANASGVKKVVDELQLGGQSAAVSAGAAAAPAPLVLQSDGTYAPASGDAPSVAPAASAAAANAVPAAGSAPAGQAQRNDPEADQQLDQQMEQQHGQAAGAATTQGANTQNTVQQYPNQQSANQQYPNQQSANQQYPNPQYPAQQYPNQQYPQSQQQAGQQPYSPYGGYGRRPMYNPNYPQAGAPYAANGGQTGYGQVAGGQVGGQSVVVAGGTMIRVRLNRPLSSNRTPAGTAFDGIVANDVVAGNEVAIPRGAQVQGTVLDAKSSGALKGRGEISIQLTSVTLGGRTYPLVSDVWANHGGDKTIETVNKTAGFGAVGAVIGALAGGGVGAAVGGGIGAAAGLGSSAASGNGQVYLPAEAVVTFHTAQPATVTTVSEQEMQRLAYGVPAGAGDQGGRYNRRAYPRVYVGPGYPGYYPGAYPGYYGGYGPYGYPNY